MTLVEVLAGLTILGSLLVGLLLARGRLVHQGRATQERLAAVAAAQHLLEHWAQRTDQPMPLSGSGPVPQHPQWVWRTQTVKNPQLEDWGAQVVRVELRPSGRQEPSQEPAVVVHVLAAKTQEAAP